MRLRLMSKEPVAGILECISTLPGRARLALPVKLSKLEESDFGGAASEAAKSSSSTAHSALDSLQGRCAQIDLGHLSPRHTLAKHCQVFFKVSICACAVMQTRDVS